MLDLDGNPLDDILEMAVSGSFGGVVWRFMNFRRAVLSDIPTMSQVRLAVRENVLADPSRIPPSIYEKYLEERGRSWVCEIDGRVVGFSAADRTDASIWALFVLPELEGRGIGKELLRLATEWLFGLGHRCVTLTTTAGTRAERFYRALGWKPGSSDKPGEVVYSLKARSGSSGG